MNDARKPWVWKKVEQEGCVTEFTLEGPDVLCRYWHDKPPSEDARLIATSPRMAEVLDSLLTELHRLSAQGNIPEDEGLTNAMLSANNALAEMTGTNEEQHKIQVDRDLD